MHTAGGSLPAGPGIAGSGRAPRNLPAFATAPAGILDRTAAPEEFR